MYVCTYDYVMNIKYLKYKDSYLVILHFHCKIQICISAEKDYIYIEKSLFTTLFKKTYYVFFMNFLWLSPCLHSDSNDSSAHFEHNGARRSYDKQGL